MLLPHARSVSEAAASAALASQRQQLDLARSAKQVTHLWARIFKPSIGPESVCLSLCKPGRVCADAAVSVAGSALLRRRAGPKSPAGRRARCLRALRREIRRGVCSLRGRSPADAEQVMKSEERHFRTVTVPAEFSLCRRLIYYRATRLA